MESYFLILYPVAGQCGIRGDVDPSLFTLMLRTRWLTGFADVVVSASGPHCS